MFSEDAFSVAAFSALAFSFALVLPQTALQGAAVARYQEPTYRVELDGGIRAGEEATVRIVAFDTTRLDTAGAARVASTPTTRRSNTSRATR
jgi:hypothetical protein